MTDLSTTARPFATGRKPPHPPGHPLRLPIPWLHELDADVAPGAAVTYPLDLTNGIATYPMWGNGPDPTLTITDAEGPPEAGEGQPVGDCHFAATANAGFLDGNPLNLTSNIVVTGYDQYEADSQGVPLGQEQDEGVVMSDALVWCLTHDWSGAQVSLGNGIVTAFVPVQQASVPATMAKYRKPLLMGVNLTPCDQTSFPNWDVSASCQPDNQDGHVVLLAELDSAPSGSNVFGPSGPISWGQVVKATAAWMNACPEEWWMPVTPADRDKMGAAAYGTLVAQMSTLPGLQGQNTPAPAPSPTPPVVPSPPPVPTPKPMPPAPPEVHQWIADVEQWVTDVGEDIAKLKNWIAGGGA